jgi:hypothetical protein
VGQDDIAGENIAHGTGLADAEFADEGRGGGEHEEKGEGN